MRIGRIESIEVLAALCLALACPPAWSAVETLEMQVGESRVLAQPGVTRVAIGNSQVLSAVATDDREVVVSARAEGVSSMHVWADAGLASYDVRVLAAGTPRLLAEVDSLLARIPGTRSTLVGSQVVIEGRVCPTMTALGWRRWHSGIPRSWTSPDRWAGTAWCCWTCRWLKSPVRDCASSASVGMA